MKTVFSETEQKAIQRAASAVWDEVAYDCLQATAEDAGKDINAVTIPRSQVIEIALDAGRAEQRLEQSTKREVAAGRMTTAQRDDFLTRYKNADYATLIKVVKPAFAYSRYGV